MSVIDDEDPFEASERLSLSQRAMAARPTPYLDGLNPAQREAVETVEGPVLMLAGAGTGKTKALTTRIAHIISTGHAHPGQILAVTFTNRAAREMKERVVAMMERQDKGIEWMGTFHSVCVKMLRRHAKLVVEPKSRIQVLKSLSDNEELIDGLDAYDQGPVPHPPQPNVTSGADEGLHLWSNFTILDTDDQLRVMKQVIVAAGIDEKRWTARQLAGLIDAWKNRAWTPEKVPSAEADAFNKRGIELYAEYQHRLLTLNAVDFGDLLLHMVTIFQNHPDLLAEYQRRFRYILVDEYQDTNVAQYLWLRLLASGHKNICCVGDDDQSIYGWRGAEVGNILRFEKDFPGAHIVRLEQNYRSTPHILAAASSVIAGNANRLGKDLWTAVESGEKVRLIGHWDGEEEARWVGEEIEALQSGTRGMAPMSLDHMAILVRASHQMRAFEDRFLTIGLPYRVIGGPRFYERMEIRDAMAYFRLAVSPGDDLAFERIVNTPKRGLGDKAQQNIQQMARMNGVSLFEGARLLVESKGIGGKGAKELSRLIDGIARWHEAVIGAGPVIDEDEGDLIDEMDSPLSPKRSVSHIELAQQILDESGYTAHWQNDKTPEAPGRLENLKELVKALESFDNLQGFLEHVSLIMDIEADEHGEKVTIMTLHGAKGLEFPAVFLPGWEDGLFPSQRSMDESGQKGLEEERRLAYVGITRAEELCTISFASNRRVFGQWQSQMPSRFVDELPPEHVEVLTPPGLYGGGYGGTTGDYGRGTIEERVSKADGYNSPGWKRLQSRSQNRGQARSMTQPREAKGITIDATAVSVFRKGDRVFHNKFGYGTVMGIEGDKLDVEFDKAGAKKVVSKFVVGAERAGDVPF